jgi:hypothetical protein
MNSRSGNRHSPPASVRLLVRTEGTSFSNGNPEPARETRLTFFDDFNLEHSSSVATRIAFGGDSGPEETATPARRYTKSQNSPSCVYFG